MATVDAIELETQVKDLYRHVAEQPHGAYHFETGRALAKRLGYPADLARASRTSSACDLGGVRPRP
jgi:arsenite methyltransferase